MFSQMSNIDIVEQTQDQLVLNSFALNMFFYTQWSRNVGILIKSYLCSFILLKTIDYISDKLYLKLILNYLKLILTGPHIGICNDN